MGQRAHLLVAVAFALLCAASSAPAESPASYLDAGQLLDLYGSMYSSIHNMHVVYICRQEGPPSSSKGHAPDRLVSWDMVDRIEEGDKYHVRYSGAADGFARPEEVMEHAFDGSVAMEYFPQDQTGSIVRGKTGRNVETLNDLKTYMFLDALPLPGDPALRERVRPSLPEDARMIHGLVSRNGKVRARLEQVAGQWCHVVDSQNPVRGALGSTAWFAADRGGLPLRFEKYGANGGCILGITVERIGTAQTETGPIWYPQEFGVAMEHGEGTVTRRVTCREFQVNIPTSEKTWKFSFPPGTRVLDHVLGTSYVTGPGDVSPAAGSGTPSSASDEQMRIAPDGAGRGNSGDATEATGPANTAETRSAEAGPALAETRRGPYHPLFVAAGVALIALTATALVVLRKARGGGVRQANQDDTSGPSHRD
jgi:hypothetical protein